MAERTEDRVASLINEKIPDTLESLAGKHQYLDKVVEYFEGAYLNISDSSASDTQSKDQLEEQARVYMLDALGSVASDIESLASNIDNLFGLQLQGINSMANQMDLVKAQIQLDKEYMTSMSLLDIAQPEMAANNSGPEQIEKESQISQPLESGTKVPARPQFKHRRIAERLEELNTVGTSLL
jgi:hypothetical protein